MRIMSEVSTAICKSTADGYLQDVAQIFSSVAANDPRLEKLGHTEFYLGW